jgi:Protein of unknown function (DUF2971)
MTNAEIIQKFFARANPPSILFHYRRPMEWTLDEISKYKIYLPKPEELNDPFECSAPVYWNIESMRWRWVEEYAPKRGISTGEANKQFEAFADLGLQKIKDGLKHKLSQTGIMCFSKHPNSIRMWAYYAEAHKGICVGYDATIRPFNRAIYVHYENPNNPFDIFACLQKDPTEIANHITLRKAGEWLFEDEYRIPVNIEGNPRFMPFHPSAIKEIRFGARIDKNPDFKEKVLEAVSRLPHRPKLIQMGCDFDRFVLTETVI